MSRIFVSYSRRDLAHAQRIYEDLVRAGHSPWFDRVDLLGGDHWRTRIEQQIQACQYFVALLSRGALNARGFLHKELRTALAILEELPLDRRFLIPVRLDRCRPCHPQLRELQWIDLFPSYGEGLKRLLQTLAAPQEQPGQLYSQAGIEVPTDMADWSEEKVVDFIVSTLWPEALNRAARDYLNVEVHDRVSAIRARAREKVQQVADRAGFGSICRLHLRG